MKTFQEYLMEGECKPFWKEVARSNGRDEAVLYGCDKNGKSIMLARIINIAKSIKWNSNPETAKMDSETYIKSVYGKLKMFGRTDPNTRFCIFLYDRQSNAEAIIPISSLKGCENEIKKGIVKLSGEKHLVPKLPAYLLRSLEAM